MGQFDRVILSGALLAACSSSPAAPSPEPPVPRARAALPSAAPAPSAGKLKPGAQRVGWLEIPEVFTRQPGSTDNDAVYEADGLSLAQVREYVFERALPEKIEYAPNGEYYRVARPTHTQLPLAPLEMALLEIDKNESRIRLRVVDTTPTAPPMKSEAQAAEVLAKMRARME